METLGYDSLWASDHVVIPWRITSKYPYNETGDFPLPPTTNFLEPLTALALVAGATERIRLGTTGLVLPHPHPVLAAKMLATLDHLAPGGGILGAGVGWMGAGVWGSARASGSLPAQARTPLSGRSEPAPSPASATSSSNRASATSRT